MAQRVGSVVCDVACMVSHRSTASDRPSASPLASTSPNTSSSRSSPITSSAMATARAARSSSWHATMTAPSVSPSPRSNNANANGDPLATTPAHSSLPSDCTCIALTSCSSRPPSAARSGWFSACSAPSLRGVSLRQRACARARQRGISACALGMQRFFSTRACAYRGVFSHTRGRKGEAARGGFATSTHARARDVMSVGA